MPTPRFLNPNHDFAFKKIFGAEKSDNEAPRDAGEDARTAERDNDKEPEGAPHEIPVSHEVNGSDIIDISSYGQNAMLLVGVGNIYDHQSHFPTL